MILNVFQCDANRIDLSVVIMCQECLQAINIAVNFAEIRLESP